MESIDTVPEHLRLSRLQGQAQTYQRLLGDPVELARGPGEPIETWHARVRQAWAENQQRQPKQSQTG